MERLLVYKSESAIIVHPDDLTIPSTIKIFTISPFFPACFGLDWPIIPDHII